MPTMKELIDLLQDSLIYLYECDHHDPELGILVAQIEQAINAYTAVQVGNLARS